MCWGRIARPTSLPYFPALYPAASPNERYDYSVASRERKRKLSECGGRTVGFTKFHVLGTRLGH
jgi:hypothetical protein